MVLLLVDKALSRRVPGDRSKQGDNHGTHPEEALVRSISCCSPRKDSGVDKFQFPQPEEVDVALEDILLSENDSRLSSLWVDRDDLRLRDSLPTERSNKPLRVGTVGKGGQGERVYSPKGHAITLSAFGGGVGAKTGMYLFGNRIRRLHPLECQKIMGFPDDFILDENPNVSYKQFGNSVVVSVVSAIAEEIEKALAKARLMAA